jgi:hypothetical protein
VGGPAVALKNVTMLNPSDTDAIETLRSFAEFVGNMPFARMCTAALRGEAAAAAVIEDALLDFSFAPCDESHVIEIMKRADCDRFAESACPRCGRSDGSHVGYHEDAELPIRRGDRVRIRAGAKIWTTLPDPARKRFTLTRSRVVTVHSMECGQTVMASLYGDAEHRRRLLELDFLIPKEDDRAKRKAMRLEVADLERGLLHCQHPGVCWVGTGGYWHHAALSDVEVVKAR